MTLARRILAVLIALRALTNFGKPFRAGTKFVILGRLYGGIAATVVAPLVGVAMVVFAWGLYQGKPWARPAAIVYAIWSTLNVVLFPIVEGVPPQFAPWMYALFAVPGIVGPWLAVWLAAQPKAR